jgi:hypothetical protein
MPAAPRTNMCKSQLLFIFVLSLCAGQRAYSFTAPVMADT